MPFAIRRKNYFGEWRNRLGRPASRRTLVPDLFSAAQSGRRLAHETGGAAMSKGSSYRGGSTLTGWNANGYVSGSGRGMSRKARLKALTATTAQTRSESAAEDDEVRRRHGLAPRAKPAPKAEPPPTNAEANARQRRLSRTSAPVVVVKVQKRKHGSRTPRRQASLPPTIGRNG
jgi:hypothetical protein